MSNSKLPIIAAVTARANGFAENHLNFRTFFERCSNVAVCYLNPLFSGQNLFGYMALLYSSASSYEDVYRHWLKSVSIGLDVLRLKMIFVI